MASKQYAVPLVLVLLLLPVSSARLSDEQWRPEGRGGAGRMVGGRTDVEDVEGNREVQELGLFCVLEHNRQGSGGSGGGGAGHGLVFSRVVAAQTQVVSGIKYYLRIAARDGRDADDVQAFDAVVVVKAWVPSRVMVSFVPAAEQPGY
ncbi:hypothetical protein ABZP36_027657 [Zizania latifolia]